MSTIIVLFNLKTGADAGTYEQWARSTDLPMVNHLKSVKKFSVLKSSGVLGGGASPFQYVEIIDLHSLERLLADISTDAMQKVAAEFRQFADAPLFIVTESVE